MLGALTSLTGGGGMSASSSASSRASQGGDYFGGSPVTLEGITTNEGLPPWTVLAIAGAALAGVYLMSRSR